MKAFVENVNLIVSCRDSEFSADLREGRGDLERRRGGDRLGGEYRRGLYGERREYDRRGGDLRRTGERDKDLDGDLE